MGPPDFRRIDFVQPVFRGNIRGYIVVEPLQRIAHIAVLFYFPVELADVVLHQIHADLGGDFPDLGMLLTVQDIAFGGFIIGRIQQDPFHNILNILDLGNRP